MKIIQMPTRNHLDTLKQQIVAKLKQQQVAGKPFSTQFVANNPFFEGAHTSLIA